MVSAYPEAGALFAPADLKPALTTFRRVDRPSIRARTVALAAAGVAAVALFAQSLAGLAGIDGRLAQAVSDERDPASVPVSSRGEGRRRAGDCPAHERRSSPPRVRL